MEMLVAPLMKMEEQKKRKQNYVTQKTMLISYCSTFQLVCSGTLGFKKFCRCATGVQWLQISGGKKASQYRNIYRNILVPFLFIGSEKEERNGADEEA